jgi:hypothetical protein
LRQENKMPDWLGLLKPNPKTGQERFTIAGKSLDTDLLTFWRWSVSDLVSNATRGRLAEFIVALAMDIPLDEPRDEWGAYDLTTPNGIKIEVKSAAYLQSWTQKRFSAISFRVPKTRAWDPITNLQSHTVQRQADVYVFALLKHQDKHSLDPLNLDQWTFYVLPTSVLNARQRSQQSITLPSLTGECHAQEVSFEDLPAAVRRAAEVNSQANQPH